MDGAIGGSRDEVIECSMAGADLVLEDGERIILRIPSQTAIMETGAGRGGGASC